MNYITTVEVRGSTYTDELKIKIFFIPFDW